MSTVTLPDPDAATLCWSTGKAKTTATWSPLNDQSWSSFVHWLDPENPAATKEVLPYVGGTLRHGQRTQRTMERRFFLTLDADYADPEFPLDTSILLHDVPYVIHTTWRHLKKGSHRYRLIIPLDRAVTPNEYKELAWSVMDQLGGEQFDVTTAQAERFMWGPSTQDVDTYYWNSANAHARYLHVDAWLDGQHRVSDTPADAPGTYGTPTPPASRTGQHSAVEATDEDRERAVEILEGACEDVEFVNEKGEFAGRNEVVFHLMPLLFRFVGANLLDEDTVLDALWTAAQRVHADEPYSQQEFDASVRSARQYAEEEGPVLPETTPSRMAAADFEDIEVGYLWDKTPRLKHVAQAADSMGRNRFALLATLLVRVLAEAPPGVCLPGVRDGAIGSRAPIHLGVAMVGSSGQGKSAFFEESAALLGVDQDGIRGDASTGQGLIQSYLKWDPDQEKNVLIPDPRRLFITDEIDKLGALGSDSGSTVMGEIRTMLTGGSTGSSNATKDRQRMLHAGSYNFQLIVGVQPSRADPLLSGRDAGTPQRFIWTAVTDPDTALHPKDRPEWPMELGWDSSFLLGFEFGVSEVVSYPDWVKQELMEYDYKVSLEGPEGGEMSRFGHQNLLRLKVAAGIAFLHESISIEDLHIEIADMIIESSRRVQVMCEKAVSDATFRRKVSGMRNDEKARAVVGKDKFDQLVARTKTILSEAKGEWVTWQNLRPAYRDRAEWEEAVWEAISADESIESERKEHGSLVRRKARMK